MRYTGQIGTKTDFPDQKTKFNRHAFGSFEDDKYAERTERRDGDDGHFTR
jgi:hypothetical protein